MVRKPGHQLPYGKSSIVCACLFCHFDFNIKSMGGGVAAVLFGKIANGMVVMGDHELEGGERCGENTRASITLCKIINFQCLPFL